MALFMSESLYLLAKLPIKVSPIEPIGDPIKFARFGSWLSSY
jgi:hypothetical protein